MTKANSTTLNMQSYQVEPQQQMRRRKGAPANTILGHRAGLPAKQAVKCCSALPFAIQKELDAAAQTSSNDRIEHVALHARQLHQEWPSTLAVEGEAG